MINRLTDTLDFHGQALVLRSERQRLIAGNIANADTPGYAARDFDFAAALRQATGAASQASPGSPALPLAASRPGHLMPAAGAAGSGAPELLYATASQTGLDRNTVDMDRERATFADNALRYEATLRFINAQAKTLLGAITGQ